MSVDYERVRAGIEEFRGVTEFLKEFQRVTRIIKGEEKMTHQVTVRRHKHSWQTRNKPLVIKNSIGQFLLSVEVSSHGMNASWHSSSGSSKCRFEASDRETAQRVAVLVGGEVVNQLELEPETLHADDEGD